MRCSVCAEINDSSAKYCIKCGTELPTLQQLVPETNVENVHSVSENSFTFTKKSHGSLASRENRLLAQLLDSAIVFVAMIPAIPFVLWAIALAVNPDGNHTGATITAILGIVVALLLVVGVSIYQLIILSTEGQTVGKKIMKIKIVKSDSGENPGFVIAVLLRSLLPGVINSFVGIFSLVDILFIFREDRRCIHDLLSTTDVVNA